MVKFFFKKDKKSVDNQKSNIEHLKEEDNNIIIDSSIYTVEDDIKPQAIAKIKPKTIVVEKDIKNHEAIKLREVSDFEQKVDKIIASSAQLFVPFKEIMTKIVPQTKGIIKLLDLFAIFIAKLTKFIVMRAPLFLRFLRSIYFKIILVFLIFMFLFGAVFSKIISSEYYVTAMEKAIHKSTGYNTKINGLVKVSFVPSFAISLNDISFFIDEPINDNNTKFKINQFSADRLNIEFRFIPLLWGSLSVKKINIISVRFDLQTSDSTVINEINYENLISEVESAIRINLSSQKSIPIEDIEEISTPSVVDTQSKDALDLLRSIDSLINGDEVKPNNQEANLDNQNDENTEESDSSESQEPQKDANLKEDSSSSKEELQSPSGGGLITDKNKGLGLSTGMLASFLAKIVNNIDLRFEKVKNFSISKGRVNIINNTNQRLIVIDNISADIIATSKGQLKSFGRLRFADNNIDFKSDIIYKADKIELDINFSFTADTSKYININGYKDLKTGQFKGVIASENQGFLTFISKFILDIDVKKIKKESFSADLEINSNFLKISNIKLGINDDFYEGSFVWDFSSYARNIVIDINAKIKDVNLIIKSINNSLSGSLETRSTFLAVVEKITNWKNSKINLFKTSNFLVNINFENTSVNEVLIDNFNLGFLVNNLNKVYIYKFASNSNVYKTKGVGKIKLDDKTAIFALDAFGDIKETFKSIGFSSQTIHLLESIANTKTDYSFSTKLRFDNNKILFTDFSGNLGDRKLKDTYIIYTQRVGESDIVLSTKFDELHSEDIYKIYNDQTSTLTYEKKEDINLFGMPENLKVKVNIGIAKATIRGIPFKDAELDISLFKNGFKINRFLANGEKGGTITISLSADSRVLPVLAGHINLDNLVLRFEDTNKLFFTNASIIGNVVINGMIKFNGQEYSKPFSNIDGEITFIKQERLSLNRFANIDGLYMTVSEKTSKGKTNIFVNDIYGRANIRNNIVELYPIGTLYIYNNKEYRGLSQIILDLKEGTIKGDGNGDRADDISNKYRFNIQGTIINPELIRTFFKGGSVSRGLKRQEKKEDSLMNQKTHSISDKLNDTKDKNHFNNVYNSNIKGQSHQDLKNQLYDDVLSDNTQGEVKYPKKSQQSRGNTDYYGSNESKGN